MNNSPKTLNAIGINDRKDKSESLDMNNDHALGDLHENSWPLHLHEFASGRVFELQSDVNFAPLQVLARTRGRQLQLSARKVNHSRPTIFCFTMPPFPGAWQPRLPLAHTRRCAGSLEETPDRNLGRNP